MERKYRDEIERLYLLMYDQLFAYARSALSSDSLAEEAVQETFRIACQKPGAVCGSQRPEGWLFVTLKNVVANMLRSRASAARLLSEYAALDQHSELVEDCISLDVVYENVAHLEEFTLLKELAIDGKSHMELAQSRGISLEACRKRLTRAKKLLQKKMK